MQRAWSSLTRRLLRLIRLRTVRKIDQNINIRYLNMPDTITVEQGMAERLLVDHIA